MIIQDPVCTLCGRLLQEKCLIEKHHCTPAAKGGKNTELVCIDCGDQIHMLFTNNELRDTYNTIEKLQAHSSVQKWVKWVRKQKNFGICMKRKKRK